MITVRIEGRRGEGATTTAMAIVRLLRMQGQTVRYVGPTRETERHVEGVLSKDGPYDSMNEIREFEVMDLGSEAC